MKLLRWAFAGASVYVIYKYSIGKKAEGKDVFVSPENDRPEPTQSGGGEEQAVPPASPKRPRRKGAKQPSK